ncbi:hypothetical protein IWQ61_002913 [Dispira simplex]|nr:hypothetical protein IWQ61_002913 [Dispira simplex]
MFDFRFNKPKGGSISPSNPKALPSPPPTPVLMASKTSPDIPPSTNPKSKLSFSFLSKLGRGPRTEGMAVYQVPQTKSCPDLLTFPSSPTSLDEKLSMVVPKVPSDNDLPELKTALEEANNLSMTFDDVVLESRPSSPLVNLTMVGDTHALNSKPSLQRSLSSFFASFRLGSTSNTAKTTLSKSSKPKVLRRKMQTKGGSAVGSPESGQRGRGTSSSDNDDGEGDANHGHGVNSNHGAINHMGNCPASFMLTNLEQSEGPIPMMLIDVLYDQSIRKLQLRRNRPLSQLLMIQAVLHRLDDECYRRQLNGEDGSQYPYPEQRLGTPDSSDDEEDEDRRSLEEDDDVEDSDDEADTDNTGLGYPNHGCDWFYHGDTGKHGGGMGVRTFPPQPYNWRPQYPTPRHSFHSPRLQREDQSPSASASSGDAIALPIHHGKAGGRFGFGNRPPSPHLVLRGRGRQYPNHSLLDRAAGHPRGRDGAHAAPRTTWRRQDQMYPRPLPVPLLDFSQPSNSTGTAKNGAPPVSPSISSSTPIILPSYGRSGNSGGSLSTFISYRKRPALPPAYRISDFGNLSTGNSDASNGSGSDKQLTISFGQNSPTLAQELEDSPTSNTRLNETTIPEFEQIPPLSGLCASQSDHFDPVMYITNSSHHQPQPHSHQHRRHLTGLQPHHVDVIPRAPAVGGARGAEGGGDIAGSITTSGSLGSPVPSLGHKRRGLAGEVTNPSDSSCSPGEVEEAEENVPLGILKVGYTQPLAHPLSRVRSPTSPLATVVNLHDAHANGESVTSSLDLTQRSLVSVG